MTESDVGKKTGKGAGYWFLILFALPFLLVGLFMGGMAAKNMVDSLHAQGWDEIPAIVESVELDRSYGSEGGTTYRALGSYRYEFDGQTYQSDRLFFGVGHDSGRDYHQKIVRTLKSKQSRNEPLTVYVNPKRPEHAVAFPAIRWGMSALMGVFALVFGGAGAGIMWMAGFAGRLEQTENKLRSDNPDKPWLWRKDWQSPVLKNSNKLAFIFACVFTGFWNLLSWPAVILGADEIFSTKNPWAWLILLFPLVGIGLMIWTIKSYAQWRRFAKTELVMKSFPGALGHGLSMEFRGLPRPPEDAEFHVKLTCLRKEESGSGEDRSTREATIWQDEQLIPAREGRWRHGFELPVFFNLPDDQPETSMEGEAEPYVWRVNLKALSGYQAMDQLFIIPVFDPKTHVIRDLVPRRSASETGSGEFVYQGQWPRTGVEYTDLAPGHYYFFPAARHKGMAFMISVMALIFGGVGLLPVTSDMPIFMGLIFGLCGLGLGLWALNLWLYKSAVEITDMSVIIRRGLFGGRFKDIPIKDVKGFELDSSMSSGTTQYYDIHLRQENGDKLKIASHLLGRRDVEDLMKKMRSELGQRDN